MRRVVSTAGHNNYGNLSVDDRPHLPATAALAGGIGRAGDPPGGDADGTRRLFLQCFPDPVRRGDRSCAPVQAGGGVGGVPDHAAVWRPGVEVEAAADGTDTARLP